MNFDTDTIASAEERDILLLIDDLLDEIQTLKKKIVRLRYETNKLSRNGEMPYPAPEGDLPGIGVAYLDNPVMRSYENFFGTYIPEY
jgi:hypothetical protein